MVIDSTAVAYMAEEVNEFNPLFPKIIIIYLAQVI